jgi:dTDP-4-amino-4,6-dideoxygalactose transaminase
MASHLEPPYRDGGALLPNTEDIAARTLQLPMHASLSPAQQDRVLAALDIAAEADR